MTKLTALDLTPFYRNSIGVDRLFDRIAGQIDHAAGTNYPPYNILRTGEDTFEIQVAVAGFSQGDIDVNLHEGQLTVTGEKTTEVDPNVVYQHQGISARKFVRSFSLADYVEVQSAECRNGILIVKLERKLPESAKPKSIAITYSN
jgi:molecular chaperone IbpA